MNEYIKNVKLNKFLNLNLGRIFRKSDAIEYFQI